MSLIYSQRQKEDQEFDSHGRRGQQEDLGHRKLSRRSSTSVLTPTIPPTNPPTISQAPGLQNVRKYLVLLQDSFAIKFVPFLSSTIRNESDNPFPLDFPLPDSPKCNNRASNNVENHRSNSYHERNRTTNNRDTLTDHNHRNGNSNNEDHLGIGWSYKSISSACHFHKGTNERPPSGSTKFLSSGSQNIAKIGNEFSAIVGPEMDHSLHGIYLYQKFREANLKCYWNGPLHEAFQKLEYKGYITPSTVLIGGVPRFLATVRTAWSRQMLRSPQGYRIEFIGEIEELLADPIQQSQFAPLSDSLCWAILEVTSSGQEAFVDAILSSLTSAFPTMIMPNRELVYQTLEKLIRERKIYQTSNGYFVVTPDTKRYMASSSPPSPRRSVSLAVDHQFSTTTLTLDTLSTQPPPSDSLPPGSSHDPDKVSRNSWDSTASAENPVRERKREKVDKDLPLRRHNSLKIIRQRDRDPGNSLKFLRGRSLSFRLYKSKSTPIDAEVVKDSLLISSNENQNPSDEKVEKKSKSGKSFFQKLFKRSSSKKSTSEALTPSTVVTTNQPSTKSLTGSATAATQTSPVEALPLLQVSEKEQITNDNSLVQKSVKSSQEQRSVPIPTTLPFETLSNSTEQLSNNRWNRFQKNELQPSNRLSSNTPIDDGPLYAYPTQQNNTRAEEVSGQNGPSIFQFSRGESSRCSTLSRGTSLGYGSQGPASSLVGFSQCQSPTPSMSLSNYGLYSNTRRPLLGNRGPPPSSSSNFVSRNSSNYGSYKNYYDYYRRKYPTNVYQQQEQEPINHEPTHGREHVALTSDRPTSQHLHFYETIGFPNRSSSDSKNPSTETVIEGPSSKNNNGDLKKSENNYSTPRITRNRSCNNEPFVSSTTTVTQNVKSTTNMEVELRLPFGKLMGTTTMQRNRKDGQGNSVFSTVVKGNDKKVSPVNNSMGKEELGRTQVRIIDQPTKNATEVKTTINHNNGSVETHFDSFNSNSKEKLIHGKNISIISQKPIRRDSYGYAVKVTDLGKDSDDEELIM